MDQEAPGPEPHKAGDILLKHYREKLASELIKVQEKCASTSGEVSGIMAFIPV